MSQNMSAGNIADEYGQMTVILNYIDFSAKFKHLSFSEENESRMSVYIFDEKEYLDKVKYRDGKYGRIPYVEIRLGLKEQDCPLKGEEIPRLCRGGSSSLTFTGVHPRNSKREPTKAHVMEILDGPIGESNWRDRQP